MVLFIKVVNIYVVSLKKYLRQFFHSASLSLFLGQILSGDSSICVTNRWIPIFDRTVPGRVKNQFVKNANNKRNNQNNLV